MKITLLYLECLNRLVLSSKVSRLQEKEKKHKATRLYKRLVVETSVLFIIALERKNLVNRIKYKPRPVLLKKMIFSSVSTRIILFHNRIASLALAKLFSAWRGLWFKFHCRDFSPSFSTIWIQSLSIDVHKLYFLPTFLRVWKYMFS